MSGAALPSVSVVMATHARRAVLPRVAEALLADPATTELVVVVDGCRDGSLEYLQDLAGRDPRVRPVWTENRGAAAAQQLGVERATGAIVLLFDDDQIAAPGMVSGHARHHAAGDADIVVGYVPVTLPARRRAGTFMVEDYARSYEEDVATWEREPARILENFWGGQISMARERLAAVPWLDPRFAMPYHYDAAFGLRCRDAGLTAVFDRALRAEHLYTRGLDGMLRDAFAKGRAMRRHRLLHGAPAPYENLAGPDNLPGRVITALLARPAPRALLFRPLVLATRLAGHARAWQVERGLGYALWFAEARRGYRYEAGVSG